MAARRAYAEHCKIPGYTGHIKGVMEQHGRTPAHAQLANLMPDDTHHHIRMPERPRESDKKDVCNNPRLTMGATMKHQDTLWPDIAERDQNKGKERKAALVATSFNLGDKRYNETISSYSRVHSRPGSARQTGIANGISHLAEGEHLNLRVISKEKLRQMYLRAFDQVDKSPVTLNALKENLSQRFIAKFNPATNCNGFSFRNSFRVFDVDGSGAIDFSEFKHGLRDFGLEFDDYQYLALYASCDPELNGTINYNRFMADTLDKEYYLLAFSGTPGFEENKQYARDHGNERVELMLKERLRKKAHNFFRETSKDEKEN